MCGRFGFFELRFFIEMLRQLELPFEEADAYQFSPSYNIAPENQVTVLAGNRQGALLANARWGLIPHWSKGIPKVRPINARAETLAVKPYFRHLLNRHHCIIPASGFYEWNMSPSGKKQPWYIHRSDNSLMAFAGLWDTWIPPEAESKPVTSCTIVTTKANRKMRDIHDRMPVILEPENWKVWLEAANTGNRSLLVPPGESLLDRYPVSSKVNSPRYIRKDCMERTTAGEI
ncbi:MAG: SOS response-associated peptidase [Chlorobiaceae bacterium]|nr:SOS response-associated peptidase [Chlorobiaceae bacterium]